MVKKESIWFLSLILFLCSCTKQPEIQYVDKIVEVKVPVVQEIKFKKPEKPVNYLKKISNKSTSKQIAEAYVNTLIEYKEYTKKLELLLEPFFDKEQKKSD